MEAFIHNMNTIHSRGGNYLPEDRSYDLYQLACKVTTKRFFPNFINLDVTFNQHLKQNENDKERFKYEVATMGCRTRVFENRHGENTCIGRGNISFLPLIQLSLLLKQREKYYMAMAVGAGNVLGEEYLEEIKRVYLSKIDHLLR